MTSVPLSFAQVEFVQALFVLVKISQLFKAYQLYNKVCQKMIFFGKLFPSRQINLWLFISEKKNQNQSRGSVSKMVPKGYDEKNMKRLIS